jgi:hypothetical protein
LNGNVDEKVNCIKVKLQELKECEGIHNVFQNFYDECLGGEFWREEEYIFEIENKIKEYH